MWDNSIPTTDTNAVSESGRESTQPENLSLDEMHRILADTRRRSLLTYLTIASNNRVSTDRLVDAVIKRETPEPGPTNHRTRVEIDLTHVHLPKLADAGVIEYDPDDERVKYTPSKALEALLAASNAMEKAHK